MLELYSLNHHNHNKYTILIFKCTEVLCVAPILRLDK
jgi:hypothetical protein